MRDNIPWGAGAVLLADRYSPVPPTVTLRDAVEFFETMSEQGKAIAMISCDVLVFGKETLDRSDIEHLVELL